MRLNRPKSEEATSARLGFQNSVHERFRTNAQAYDKSVLEKLGARRGPDYAPTRSSFLPLPRPSLFKPETGDPYPSTLADTEPLSFQINDDLTEPLDNVASQKRRASSLAPDIQLFPTPRQGFSKRDWAEVKETIRELYLDQGHRALQVIQYLQENHGFRPT